MNAPSAHPDQYTNENRKGTASTSQVLSADLGLLVSVVQDQEAEDGVEAVSPDVKDPSATSKQTDTDTECRVDTPSSLNELRSAPKTFSEQTDDVRQGESTMVDSLLPSLALSPIPVSPCVKIPNLLGTPVATDRSLTPGHLLPTVPMFVSQSDKILLQISGNERVMWKTHFNLSLLKL